jgi:hypothetical protein
VVSFVISVVSSFGIFLAHLVCLKFVKDFVKASKSYGSELSWREFPGIPYFSDLKQTKCARKISKPVLKTTLIIKEATYTSDFGKYFVVSFWSHSIRAFSVLLEDL